jgi:hypothetical protein
MSDEHVHLHADHLHGAASEAPIEADERSRPWWRWFIGMVAIGVALGIVLVLAYRFVNGPVSASASGIALPTVTATPTPKPTNHLTGLDIEFDYPGIFDELGHVNNDAQAVEQYNISSKADYRRVIAVSVHPLPSGSLAEDSNYRYRQNNPSIYTETKGKIGTAVVVLMTKTDKTEQTLFWVNNKRIAIFAITSTVPHDDVLSFMQFVMPTIGWRS